MGNKLILFLLPPYINSVRIYILNLVVKCMKNPALILVIAISSHRLSPIPIKIPKPIKYTKYKNCTRGGQSFVMLTNLNIESSERVHEIRSEPPFLGPNLSINQSINSCDSNTVQKKSCVLI